MRVIGITGSSGSGKSTISKILKSEYDAKIVDADVVVENLSRKGTKYFSAIVNTFGVSILNKNIEIDKKKLAHTIFSDGTKKELLDSLTFKYVKEEIEKQVLEFSGSSLVVVDAPLLFESGLNGICEFVIGVISSKELQIERIMERDNISKNDAEKRLKSQKHNEYYKEKCDYIIENNGEIVELKRKVEEIIENIPKSK